MAIKTGGGVRPGVVPGLQQKEAAQTKQSQAQGPKGKVSAQDAARIASQAGFQRLGANKKKNFSVGNSDDQQFSLPADELDEEIWTQERLDSAQGSMSLASTQFGEAAKASEGGASIGAAIVGSSFMPSEDDIAEMEDIAKRKAPQPMPMLEEVSTSVGKLFGIQLDDDVPVGHVVLAAGLVVAGEPGSVSVGKGGLDEGELAGGLEKVTKRGNQSVGEAQSMNKGVSEKLNLQRTFMFRR